MNTMKKCDFNRVDQAALVNISGGLGSVSAYNAATKAALAAYKASKYKKVVDYTNAMKAALAAYLS